MKQVLIAGILGGIVLFIWGFISWVVLPWHNAVIKSLPQDQTIIQSFKESNLKSGVYFFPGMPEAEGQEMEAAREEWEQQHLSGPIGMLFYHKQGTKAMAASTFVWGIIISIISALIAAFLLQMGVEQIGGYGRRVLFVALLGLFAGFVTYITNWNWMYAPAGYTIVNTIDLVIGWLIGGLVIAWRIKPAPTA